MAEGKVQVLSTYPNQFCLRLFFHRRTVTSTTIKTVIYILFGHGGEPSPSFSWSVSPTTEWCAEFFVMEGHNDFAMADTLASWRISRSRPNRGATKICQSRPPHTCKLRYPYPMAGVPGREFRLGSHFLLQPDFPNFVCRLMKTVVWASARRRRNAER